MTIEGWAWGNVLQCKSPHTPNGREFAVVISRTLIGAILALGLCGQAIAGGLEDGQNAVLRGDYQTALARFLPMATAGNTPAQYELGRMYQGGQGVVRDYRQAAIWYRKASLGGDSRAQLLLALLYARGQGVQQDNIQGLYWLRKASEGVDPAKRQGMLMLYYQVRGEYDGGRRLDANELAARALPSLQKMADAGDPSAQCALAQLYSTGQAVPRRDDDVARLHLKCAEHGYEHSGQPPPPGLELSAPMKRWKLARRAEFQPSAKLSPPVPRQHTDNDSGR